MGNAVFYFSRLGNETAESDTDRPIFKKVLKPIQVTGEAEVNFREFVKETFNPHCAVPLVDVEEDSYC